MNDYGHIVDRNTKALNKLIIELGINRSLEELVNNFDRLFYHDDDKAERLRLLGIERTGEFDVSEKFDNKGGFLESKQKEKKRQIQLYVLKKRDYQVIEDSVKNAIYSKLDFFIMLWKQLKSINEIDLLESVGYKFVEEYKSFLIEEYVD